MFKKNKKVIMLMIFFYLILISFSIESISATRQAVKTKEEKNIEINPASFSQPTFHPTENDIFGPEKDTCPIFKVEIDENDDNKKNKMAITFDSAFINEHTYKILDTLDRYGVKATFFMTANFIKNNYDQVAEILKRGHEIGNHSTTHEDFKKLTKDKIKKEVMNCHNALKDKFDIDMCLFRFPYGSYDKDILSQVKSYGYYPIQWSCDSLDWRNVSVDAITSKFKTDTYLYPGAIILFHNGATYTPDALPTVLNTCKRLGLKCVRVSDLIYKHDFNIKQNNGLQMKKD